MPGKMLSLVSVAALMAAVVATPHPECEPCATVADAELDALTNSNKVRACVRAVCRSVPAWVVTRDRCDLPCENTQTR